MDEAKLSRVKIIPLELKTQASTQLGGFVDRRHPEDEGPHTPPSKWLCLYEQLARSASLRRTFSSRSQEHEPGQAGDGNGKKANYA